MSEDPSPSKTGIGAGYDAGYAQCPCFWGEEPGRLIGILRAEIGDFSGLRVLDAGCGEGKNAAYLARQGADVEAIDASALAINNGRRAFGTHPHLRWRVEDVRVAQFRDEEFDVVIAYGLLHCLPSHTQIEAIVRKLQRAATAGGYMIVCAFNDRITDLRAHPGFRPTFLSHATYRGLFDGWHLVFESDEDLWETHPHNSIRHVHSMTRLVAQKQRP